MVRTSRERRRRRKAVGGCENGIFGLEAYIEPKILLGSRIA
jgi:hypothetical protein